MLLFEDRERNAVLPLIEMAFGEDLGNVGDLTCRSLIPQSARAEVLVVARHRGVFAGGPVAELVFARLDPQVVYRQEIPDGSALSPGTRVATVSGALCSLLTGERTCLNFLTHLSGIATLTRRFVEAVQPFPVRILDTRKTHPGWRVLEKYAVRAGGGTNHRMGLFDGCLIKDNHLAAWAEESRLSSKPPTIAEAIRQARSSVSDDVPVEVEVDTLDQLRDALEGSPDIVLLDNMTPAQLRQAVAIRDRMQPNVLLEASGGITLETIREIAQTGVERISIGALTHSAPACDLAFDWSALLNSGQPA
jgi:nicotinate-nucleotide pyrophosphorylase (carboxylating)